MSSNALSQASDLGDESLLGGAGFIPLSMPLAETPELLDAVLSAYSPGVLKAGLGACDCSRDNLLSYLEAAALQIRGRTLGWANGFGVTHDALTNRISALTGLVEIALHLSASGFAGSWSAQLPAARRWLFGNLLLPATDRLAVDAADGSATIRLAGQMVLHLEGKYLSWRCREPSINVERLGVLAEGAERPWAVICAGLGLFAYAEDLARALVPHPVPCQMTEICSEAMWQIAAAAPTYLPWVTDITRAIVPCIADPGTLSSGSCARAPGVLRITYDSRPEAIVEMLVHEASHQYLNIGCMTGDLADPSDERLFYSPVKQTGRRIDRILLAYHAFANVEAVYAGCIAAGIGDQNYYQPQFERTVDELDLMEEHLISAGTLTSLGRDLVMPLIARRGRN